jgi:hypothetical protein
MKLSVDTLNILRNFATIGQSILIKPGNTLRIRSTAVFAEANVPEEFPLEFGIYDLSNFLNAVSLFSEPDFIFEENAVRIIESDDESMPAEVKYVYSGPGMAMNTHRKGIEYPKEFIQFTLTENALGKLQKAAGVFGKSFFRINSDGQKVFISTDDPKNPEGNAYSIEVESEPNDLTCNMYFNFEYLKFYRGAYTSKITKLFTEFKHQTMDLTYLIGQVPGSTFDGQQN